MIISDLSYIEVLSGPNNIVGGFSLADYLTDYLPIFSTASSNNATTSLSAPDGNMTASSEIFSTNSSEGGDSVRVSIFTQGGGQAASFAQSGDLVTSLSF